MARPALQQPRTPAPLYTVYSPTSNPASSWGNSSSIVLTVSAQTTVFSRNVFDSPAAFHAGSGRCRKPQDKRGMWRACNFTPLHSLTGPVGEPFASRLVGQRFASITPSSPRRSGRPPGPGRRPRRPSPAQAVQLFQRGAGFFTIAAGAAENRKQKA